MFIVRRGTIELFPGCANFGKTSQLSTNKTDCHDIAEILLKVTLNSIKHQTNLPSSIANQGWIQGGAHPARPPPLPKIGKNMDFFLA
jgi:hypothetical protein